MYISFDERSKLSECRTPSLYLKFSTPLLLKLVGDPEARSARPSAPCALIIMLNAEDSLTYVILYTAVMWVPYILALSSTRTAPQASSGWMATSRR